MKIDEAKVVLDLRPLIRLCPFCLLPRQKLDQVYNDHVHSGTPFCNMRVIMCGDREWGSPDYIGYKSEDYYTAGSAVRSMTSDKQIIHDIVKNFPKGTVVIEGEATGADKMSATEGMAHSYLTLPFPARWDLHGRAAGPIRNQQMIDEGKPTHVIWFHHDISKSKGTKDMVRRAEKCCIPTFSWMEWLNIKADVNDGLR